MCQCEYVHLWAFKLMPGPAAALFLTQRESLLIPHQVLGGVQVLGLGDWRYRLGTQCGAETLALQRGSLQLRSFFPILI